MNGHVLRMPNADEAAVIRIGDIVAGSFGVGFEQIVGRERTRPVADARTALIALMRSCTGISSPRLGAILHLDHATVLHACKRAPELAAVDRGFAYKFATARARTLAEFTPPELPQVARATRLAPQPEDFLQPA